MLVDGAEEPQVSPAAVIAGLWRSGVSVIPTTEPVGTKAKKKKKKQGWTGTAKWKAAIINVINSFTCHTSFGLWQLDCKHVS